MRSSRHSPACRNGRTPQPWGTTERRRYRIRGIEVRSTTTPTRCGWKSRPRPERLALGRTAYAAQRVWVEAAHAAGSPGSPGALSTAPKLVREAQLSRQRDDDTV